MQHLPANVSVLVTPCHTSALLWKEDTLSGLDQLLIVHQPTITYYYHFTITLILELVGRVIMEL